MVLIACNSHLDHLGRDVGSGTLERNLDKNPDAGDDDHRGKCCRNGIKRVILGQSSMTAARSKGAGLPVVVEEEEVEEEDSSIEDGDKDEDASSEEDGNAVGKKRKRGGRGKEKGKGKKVKKNSMKEKSIWLTDGTPPPVHDGVNQLILDLSSLNSNKGAQYLMDFVQDLLKPMSSVQQDVDPLSLRGAILDCMAKESSKKIENFYYLVSTIRLSCHIQKYVTLLDHSLFF